MGERTVGEMVEDARRGLEIAERATEGPWTHLTPDGARIFAKHDSIADVVSWNQAADRLFMADARTRAVQAYRDVETLAGLVAWAMIEKGLAGEGG